MPDDLTTALQQPGLDITVRTGSGTARTMLAAFDNALLSAGVANFNLIALSSVIPPRSRVRTVDTTLPGGHGDRLYCVLSAAYADQPGQVAWAGLGWSTDATTGGLFVEHHGDSEESLRELIDLSLCDMNESRGRRLRQRAEGPLLRRLRRPPGLRAGDRGVPDLPLVLGWQLADEH